MKNKKLNTPANRALSISVALHVSLLAALAFIGYDAVPSITSVPGTLRVSVMPVFDGLDESPDAGTAAEEDEAADAEPEPPAPVAEVEDIAEPPPLEETPDAEPTEPERLVEAPAPDRVQTVPAPPPEPNETVAEAPAPEPVERDEPAETPATERAEIEPPEIGTVADEPPPEPDETRLIAEDQAHETSEPPLVAEDQAEEPSEAPTETAVVPETDAEILTTEAQSERESLVDNAPSASAAASEATAPATTPPTTPVTEAERRLLEHEVESFARSFVALGEWQPSTTWTHRGREYEAKVTRLPAESSMGIDEAVVVVSTEVDGKRASTEMRMQRLSFSHFAQFVDRWDNQVQIHDDVIDGRFHSNSEVFITRAGGVQPTFIGKVTTARGINTSMSERSVRRSEVFLGGLETRAGRIALPNRVVLFADDQSVDPARVHRFTTATRIEFLPDGSYVSHTVETRGRSRGARGTEGAGAPAETGPMRRTLGEEPHYLIAADDAPLYVSGTLDGKVLVYSPEDIVIEGNLTYASDPALDPASDDYLGLVSERNVEIAPPDVTGPGDLTIEAAIYARRRFSVANYRSRAAGTLFVHGSVTAGSISATEPRYRTQIHFDQRLAELRPPRFPQTDRFEIASWDGNWILE